MTSESADCWHPTECGNPAWQSASRSNGPIAAAQRPDDLIQSSDEELRDLISENLNPDRAAPGLWAILTRPPLASRVRGILIAMQMGAEKDIRARRWRRDERRSRLGVDQSSDYEQDYCQWHARAVAFRRMVQDRITQTRAGASEDNLNKAELLQWQHNSVRKLVEAIDRHRCALGADVHPEPADQTLWKILDDVTVPVGPNQLPVSVRDMVDSYWTPDADHERGIVPGLDSLLPSPTRPYPATG